jgi:hypothetical protein
MSLNDVYQMGMKHALEVIQKNGGKVEGENISLALQIPTPVRLEQSFINHFPVAKDPVTKNSESEYSFDFEGNGFVVRGEAQPKNGSNWDYKGEFVYNTEISIDGSKPEEVSLPVRFTTRRHELFWKYELTPGKHQVKFKILNLSQDYVLNVGEVIVYQPKP